MLEREARAVVVPGEETGWREAIRTALARTRAVWNERRSEREKLRLEVLDQDPELANRVQALENEEAALEEELRQIERSAESPETERLRARILRWSNAWRTHEEKARTWLAEAYYRDRGVAD